MKMLEDMNGWQIAGITVGAILLVGLLSSRRDIARYIRIYSM